MYSYGAELQRAVDGLCTALNESLGLTSNNPAFFKDGSSLRFFSSPSFMATQVASDLAAVQRAVEFAASGLSRICVATLESRPSGLHGTDKSDEMDLGMIQVPKAALAIYGRLKTLSASQVTDYVCVSEGVEDLGSGLVLASERLTECIDLATDLANILIAVISTLVSSDAKKGSILDVFEDYVKWLRLNVKAIERKSWKDSTYLKNLLLLAPLADREENEDISSLLSVLLQSTD